MLRSLMLKHSCGFFHASVCFCFAVVNFIRTSGAQLENDFVKILEAQVDAFTCLVSSSSLGLFVFEVTWGIMDFLWRELLCEVKYETPRINL